MDLPSLPSLLELVFNAITSNLGRPYQLSPTLLQGESTSLRTLYIMGACFILEPNEFLSCVASQLEDLFLYKVRVYQHVHVKFPLLEEFSIMYSDTTFFKEYTSAFPSGLLINGT
jgi:hypothetical protein